MSVIWVDGESFDAVAAAGDQVVIAFSRREVMAGQLGDALDRLLSISDNAENVHRFKDSLTFIFEGIDGDPREVHQVPEVVGFFRNLTARWPYWTHFAEKRGDTVSLLVSLLCDVEVVTTTAGITSCGLKDPRQLQDVLMALFDGQNALYEAHDISEAENMAMTNSFLNALDLGPS